MIMKSYPFEHFVVFFPWGGRKMRGGGEIGAGSCGIWVCCDRRRNDLRARVTKVPGQQRNHSVKLKPIINLHQKMKYIEINISIYQDHFD